MDDLEAKKKLNNVSGVENIEKARDKGEELLNRRVSEVNDKLRKYMPHTIQSTILVAFTVVSFTLLLILGLMLYTLFARRMRNGTIEATQQIMEQSVVNLEDYLVSMRRISDAMYYDVIKNADLERDSVDNEMNIIYEAHKDNLVSLSLFMQDGTLVSASPISSLKSDLRVTDQKWFTSAFEKMENLHFSTPHVENLFLDPAFKYSWVISLSRVVELTENGSPSLGVLLVDMNYSTIKQMMERINTDSTGQYIYLTDSSGNIIYHPKQMQINYEIIKENNINNAHYADGIHDEVFGGEKRQVIVDSISYTGWKMIAVLPEKAYQIDISNMRFLVILLIACGFLIMIFINKMISSRISRPLNLLNKSIRNMENGDIYPEDIYVGGTREVEHLGKTLRHSLGRINQLMDDIVIEQEEKRKTEMDALQSQINPHFLYNTLDSIVWMIEGEKNKDAVFMVTQLASLFRISLSRGKNIIPVEQEMRHAENYMNIQKVRYKNNFKVTFDVQEEVKAFATIKLIVQPILENAIYYGVGDMDPDDEGEIIITARFVPYGDETYLSNGDYNTSKKTDDGKNGLNTVTSAEMDENNISLGDIYIEVKDNGFGMPPEVCENLLNDSEGTKRPQKHGSGVGLVNVHRRIKLRFGEQYGLKVESEPDEGTCITIHIPAVPFNEENQKLLESGHYKSLRNKSTHAASSDS
ncbi:two-component system, sensor histidine kinase YesM [Oribacterium sp. KHPX15]|uniref:cache domain-containing sensor histidine kinase n=1 Tax=Oribacterium sp. KHPX15 TaxID=1855342 RepID=UPI000898F5B4|nr:histidine kinase [Oribacterium sp. KHPX15]SEA13128.1 two-component system, sensor histidine kinase YesM [Oribacterium sp. KHPX15]